MPQARQEPGVEGVCSPRGSQPHWSEGVPCKPLGPSPDAQPLHLRPGGVAGGVPSPALGKPRRQPLAPQEAGGGASVEPGGHVLHGGDECPARFPSPRGSAPGPARSPRGGAVPAAPAPPPSVTCPRRALPGTWHPPPRAPPRRRRRAPSSVGGARSTVTSATSLTVSAQSGLVPSPLHRSRDTPRPHGRTLTFVGVREPELGGAGVGAAEGRLGGGRGGAGGVCGGARAQAAGQEAPHEGRGG